MPKQDEVPSLLAELQEFLNPRGPRCGIAATLAAMEPGMAVQFVGLLGLPISQAPHASIARMMRAKGFPLVTDNCLNRHRRGDCSCR